jgi:hypothetical protein
MSRYLNSPREADWYACPTCGDEVTLRGWLDARGDAPRIGLGECSGVVLPAI